MTSIEYYFDTLPLHPPPQELESLTGYVTRVAKANSIQSIAELSKVMGVNEASLKNLTDYSFQTIGDLAERTALQEEKLLATTLFHLGKKFGRLKSSLSLANFLSGSICSYFRYCPECIAEESYHSLTWRFLALPGCKRHRLKFLEHCGHCGSVLPLLSSHLTIGMCFNCRRDLRFCHAKLLSEQEQRLAHSRALDLEYLLLPDLCEDDNHLVKWVGYRFAQLRRERQISMKKIADQTAIPEYEIMSIEQGGIFRYALFHEYMRYADYFGVTLQDMFQNKSMLSSQETQSSTHQSQQFLLRQHEGVVLEHVQEVMKDLAARGEMVTQTTIMERMHTTSKTLKRYVSVDALWKQILMASQNEERKERVKYRQSRGEELHRQVEKVIAILRSSGQQPYRKTIGELVGLSLVILQSYPHIKELLMQYPLQAKHAPPDEDYVIERVYEAITYLRSLKRTVSKAAISEHVGMSLVKLKEYPRVKVIMGGKRFRLDEDYVIEQVNQAIVYLRSLKRTFSQAAISKQVGISIDTLRAYPRVEVIMECVRREYFHRHLELIGENGISRVSND